MTNKEILDEIAQDISEMYECISPNDIKCTAYYLGIIATKVQIMRNNLDFENQRHGN